MMLKKMAILITVLLTLSQVCFSADERYVDSDGAQLFCRTLGEGKPLVVIHGGPGLTQDYLLPQLEELAANNFVIFYDQRGCGKSTGEINDETITIATFVNDLDNLRKAFGFEKISVLGHSWGGFLAMEYAIAYPESLDKLILANSMPSTKEGLELASEEVTRRIAPFENEMDSITENPLFEQGDTALTEQLYRIIFRTYCYNPDKADLLNLRMPAHAVVRGTEVSYLFNENLFENPFNLENGLNNLSIPTLIIHGDFDPIPASTAQEIHHSINGSKLVLIEECGHFPYVEKPEVFFATLREFLRD